jgi:hypothetical protein
MGEQDNFLKSYANVIGAEKVKKKRRKIRFEHPFIELHKPK